MLVQEEFLYLIVTRNKLTVYCMMESKKGGSYLHLPRQELLSSSFWQFQQLVSTERPKIRRYKPRHYSSRPMPSLLQVPRL
jgi:hypothetical protein